MSPELLYRSFVDAMIQRCRYVPGGAVAESAGLVTAFTNLAPTSSYCFFSRAAELSPEFERRITEAISTGGKSTAPWSLGVLGDWIAGNAPYIRTLEARGFDRRVVVYGMWTERLSSGAGVAPRIEFRRVATDDDLATFATINNAAHGFDADAGTAIYRHYLCAPRSHAFVGFVDGEPVATAAAFPTDVGVYLGGVATVAHHRGRGYGDAASRHAIQFVMRESEMRHAVLFASRDRTAFYSRMGFTIGAELWLFRQSRGAPTVR